jgi:serine/threonine protein kinase
LQVLLSNIVTQEIIYPSFLSPAIVDLLRRILTKNPENRITLKEIREHEWFSQERYSELFSMQLSERSNENIVDNELLEQLEEMGIEAQHLKQQLLLGAFTELTAVYRMLKRDRLTDQISEKLTNWAETSRIRAYNSSEPLGHGVDVMRPMLPILRPKSRFGPRIGLLRNLNGRLKGNCGGSSSQSGDQSNPATSQKLQRPVTRNRASSPLTNRLRNEGMRKYEMINRLSD